MKRLLSDVAVAAPLLLLALPGPAAQPASPPPPSRGQMLYDTHCIACHTTHVHWRDNRLATDWDSLVHQVGRWADNTHLSWNEQDVAAVSAYLNRLYYQFPVGNGAREIGRQDGVPSRSATPPLPASDRALPPSQPVYDTAKH